MPGRGQSAVIGFVMLFGILILLMLTLQTTAVPAWNQAVEYSHNERVQGELELLRDDVFRTASTGSAGSESVSLGTQYPVRPFLFNPADPSGRVGTTDPGTVTITNATAAGEAGDYWDGSPRRFADRALVYDPNYNEYDNAPTTVLENTVLFNRFGERTLPATGQSLISGRRVNVVALDGNLSRGGQRPYSVELRPLSAPQQVTTVRSDGPLVVTAPTRLSEDAWTDLLAGERVEAGGYVTDLSVTPGDPGTLRVTLAAGESYDLRMAKVGVGSQLEDPPAHYITADSPSDLRLASGSAERVVFEVRDRYNNPVSGVTVNATVSGPGALTPVNSVTGADGHASFRYEAVGAGAATVSATFGTDPGTMQTANVTVESVQPAAGGEQALTVEWIGPSSGEGDTYTLDAGADDTATLTVASSPAVEGLDLQYVVNDSSVGTVSPTSGATDAAGQDSVTFTANADGVVDVYAVGGGDADVMTVTVTNATGGGGPTATPAPSNQPPTAEFTVDRSGNSDRASLDGSPSSDPDGTIVSYEWDVGDDGTVDYTGETTGVRSIPPGTVVTLIVTDDGGATDRATRAIS